MFIGLQPISVFCSTNTFSLPGITVVCVYSWFGTFASPVVVLVDVFPSFSIVAPLFPFCPISTESAFSPVFGKKFPLSLFSVSLLFRFPLSAMLVFVLLLSSLFSTV